MSTDVVVLVAARVTLLSLVAGAGAVDADAAEDDFLRVSLHFIFDCHGKELLDSRPV